MKVLVTGASRYVGAHLAARLAAHPRVDRVTGFDTVAPSGRLRDLLAEHDIPVSVGEVRGVVAAVTGGEVDAVAHMGVVSTPGSGGRPRVRGRVDGARRGDATPRRRGSDSSWQRGIHPTSDLFALE